MSRGYLSGGAPQNASPDGRDRMAGDEDACGGTPEGKGAS